jgi:hypothetical protein
MHDYYDNEHDRGFSVLSLINSKLLEFVTVCLVYGLLLGVSGLAVHQFLLLRDRVEAIEHTLSQPIEIEIRQFEPGHFEELEFPGEQFEVPPLEPREGGVC